MSNSETETRPTKERRYWISGFTPLGKRQTADLARERSWKADSVLYRRGSNSP